MNRFSKTKIYLLSSPHTNKVYVGSTHNSLAKRMSDHKYDHLHRPSKAANSKEILSYPDAQIYLLEEKECFSRKDKFELEQKWITWLVKENYPNAIIVNKANPLASSSKADDGKVFSGPEVDALLEKLKEALGVQDFGEDHVFTHEFFELSSKLLDLRPVVRKVLGFEAKVLSRKDLSGIGKSTLGVVQTILEKTLRLTMVYRRKKGVFQISEKVF